MAAALLLSVAPLSAQSLAERISGAPDGAVRMTVPSRPGICGNGESISMRDPERESDARRGRWDEPCVPGPLRIEMRVRRGTVENVSTRVGSFRATQDQTTDLGTIPAEEAVEYLLGLAERAPESVGKDAIFPAVAADADPVHPQLLRLARNEAVPEETRRSAIFWLSQQAGDAITRGLGELVENEREELGVREHVVFALSQRPPEEAIPALVRVARSNPEPRLRQRALFWLGQTGDPRALEIFEEILLGPRSQ
jgi:hypothetical protein